VFDLIVFDLDGTLVDSSRDIAESANALLESCGARPLPEEMIGPMVGDGAATLVARAFVAAGAPRPADALDRFLAIYDARLLKYTRPYERMPEVLAALAARAPLAVLTNKPLAATRSILSGLDLAKYFDDESVVGGDGPFARKPDPLGLCHLMSRARVLPAHTLLVGDSIVDFRTARNASTHICLARYGFGFATVPLDALDVTTRLIDSATDLLRL